MKKPNVLYIMADQFNANCLGALGAQVKTPVLDNLVEKGVLFNKAFCNYPICAPSRCSFITGQYPHTHGIYANDIYEFGERNENTLGAVFRRAGYQTALIGKSHMIGEWDREGFEYIRYCDMTDCLRGDPLENHYFKYLYDNGIADLYDNGTLHDMHPGSNHKGFISEIPYRHTLEPWTGDETLQFLEHRDKTRPFFIHMSFERPHEPLSIPYDYELLYNTEDIKLPDSASDLFERGFAGKPAKHKKHADNHSLYPYIPDSREDLKRQLAFYYTLITMIDEQIGRVIKKLVETGEYDNTAIVFTADHGDFAGEHGMMFKSLGIYESIHRIPFILKYPGCPENIKIEKIIESIDLFPTLCHICNLEVPETVEGTSVLPIIEQMEDGKEYAVCEWDSHYYNGRIFAIRTNEYRLIYGGMDEDGELYDLKSDPDELKNLYNNRDYQVVCNDLKQKLFIYISQYRAKLSSGDARKKMYRYRNCMDRLIQKEKVNWKEIEKFYRH